MRKVFCNMSQIHSHHPFIIWINIQIPISSVVVGGDVETDEQTAVSVKIKPSDIMTTE